MLRSIERPASLRRPFPQVHVLLSPRHRAQAPARELAHEYLAQDRDVRVWKVLDASEDDEAALGRIDDDGIRCQHVGRAGAACELEEDGYFEFGQRKPFMPALGQVAH